MTVRAEDLGQRGVVTMRRHGSGLSTRHRGKCEGGQQNCENELPESRARDGCGTGTPIVKLALEPGYVL
jgi:hypothetical protein